MKSKKLLLGFTLLACITFLVACQNSIHKKDITQNSVKTKTSKKETVSGEERQSEKDIATSNCHCLCIFSCSLWKKIKHVIRECNSIRYILL